MKIIAPIFCLILFSCTHSSTDRKLVSGSAIIKYFDEAKEILPSWSNKNTLVYHIITEPDNLHPTNGNSHTRSEIFQYTQRSLIYFDFKTQNLFPGLVETMPVISSDSLSYTYTLRDNIRWDDNSLLTPSDIIFTGKAIKCPLTNNPSIRSYWNNVKEIVAGNDERTFTIHMYKKNYLNISFLNGFPILQRSFHDSNNALSTFSLEQFKDTSFNPSEFPDLVEWANKFNDDANGRVPGKLNGLGMYKVQEWQSGQYIVLEKKSNHWTKNSESYLEYAYPEKIIFKLNKEEASQILDFRNQRLDASTNCSVNALLQLTNEEEFNRNYNSALLPTFNYTYIAFNEKPDIRHKPLFTDVRVRRAIAMLTPVEDLMKIAYSDFSNQCRRIVSNVSPLKKDYNQSLKALQYDLVKAKQVLNESGWNDSDGDGILDKVIEGKSIRMIADLNYLTTSQEWKNMAVYIAEHYAKAGIKINLVPMDLKLFVEKGKSHDFDLMLGSWSGTGLPEDHTQLWHTASWLSNGSNYSGFGDEHSDKIIEQMRVELNDSIRAILSKELQEIIYDDQPFVFLYSSLRRYIIHRRFANQMVFAERPGILCSDLRLLSITDGITMQEQSEP